MTETKETNTARKDELSSYLRKHSPVQDAYDLYSPEEGLFVPGKFRDLQQRIRDMEVYEDDTWLVTYPRTGASWVRPLIWLIANDLDYSNETSMLFRFPFLEMNAYHLHQGAFEATGNCQTGDSVDYVINMKRPRFIWSHLPLSMLPTQLVDKKPKIVLLKRNPKDVAVSFYYFFCAIGGYTGCREIFFEALRAGILGCGCYWHHTESFRKLYGRPNVVHLTYEDMKKDYMSSVKKVADFYGKSYTDEEFRNLENFLSFSNMKNVKTLNLDGIFDKLQDTYKWSAPKSEFIRKGESGGYRNEMSEETIKAFDDWSREMKKKLNLTDEENILY